MKLKDKKIVILFKDKNQFENFKRQNFHLKIYLIYFYIHIMNWIKLMNQHL